MKPAHRAGFLWFKETIKPEFLIKSMILIKNFNFINFKQTLAF
ncbi:hypothetical protein U757_09280 [Streptococcus mitis 21/39]|uniref:Uncharacterized protein n=1 Tax=Streptococcus mitis 21/39 TaxID=1415765 RepID=V8I151_STRMT|nr:hypothetical protein U757_09280 [Streptococcus mitis 21/39]